MRHVILAECCLRLSSVGSVAGVRGIAVGGTPEYMAPETLEHLAGGRCAADLRKAGKPCVCLQRTKLLVLVPAHKREAVTQHNCGRRCLERGRCAAGGRAGHAPLR